MLDLEAGTVRTLTKVGMGVTLATTVWTGLGRGRRNWTLHTWAGIALVGFSVWHANIYHHPIKKALPTRAPPRNSK